MLHQCETSGDGETSNAEESGPTSLCREVRHAAEYDLTRSAGSLLLSATMHCRSWMVKAEFKNAWYKLDLLM